VQAQNKNPSAGFSVSVRRDEAGEVDAEDARAFDTPDSRAFACIRACP
jgi:hypothetical protein